MIPMTSAFTIEVAADGTILFQGELLLTTVEQALAQSRKLFLVQEGDLTVDLSGVGRGDSAGLALLIHWVRELRGSGRYLSFIHVPPHLMRLAEASDLTNILPFSSS